MEDQRSARQGLYAGHVGVTATQWPLGPRLPLGRLRQLIALPLERLRRLIALPLVFLAPALVAHDLWLEPSSYRPGPGEPVHLSLQLGDDAAQAETIGRHGPRLRRFEALLGQEVASVPGQPGLSPAGWWRPSAAGLARVVYESDPRQLQLPAGKFESYLQEEGLEWVIEERRRLGEAELPGRESYSRSLKLLLPVGPPATAETEHRHWRDQASGLALELVVDLETAPRPGSGRELPMQLLYLGQPVAGALVEARPLGGKTASPGSAGSLPPLQQRTDSQGKARFVLETPGPWGLYAVHIERAETGASVDWRSYWTSLVLSLERD